MTICAPLSRRGASAAARPLLLTSGMTLISASLRGSAIQILDLLARVLIRQHLVEALVGGRLLVPLDLVQDTVDDPLLGRMPHVEHPGLELQLFLLLVGHWVTSSV
jgi:hypothetical protein